PRFRVVAYDCGIKHNILRQLRMAGAHVTVVPAATPAEAVLETKPDGVFLSNGPGDPEAVPYLIEPVRGLLGRLPAFGICLDLQRPAATRAGQWGGAASARPAPRSARGRPRGRARAAGRPARRPRTSRPPRPRAATRARAAGRAAPLDGWRWSPRGRAACRRG